MFVCFNFCFIAKLLAFFTKAAQKFYSLLVLKKFQVLELEQEDAYEEIFVLKGLKFDNPVL